MPKIPQIRPVLDLRNKFGIISRQIHSTNEPVYLTKNGRGDMVVMSMEAYEKELFESEVYLKLKEAEFEAETTSKRYTHEEVMNRLKQIIASSEKPTVSKKKAKAVV